MMKRTAFALLAAAACLSLNGCVLSVREYDTKKEKKVEKHTILFFFIPIYHSSDSRGFDEEGEMVIEIEKSVTR